MAANGDERGFKAIIATSVLATIVAALIRYRYQWLEDAVVLIPPLAAHIVNHYTDKIRLEEIEDEEFDDWIENGDHPIHHRTGAVKNV